MKKNLVLILVLLLCVFCFGCNETNISQTKTSDVPEVPMSKDVKQPTSYTELKNLIKVSGYVDDTTIDYEDAPNETTEETGTSDYTQTNTQVSGIDEGDIIKVDGSHIYTLNTNGITIVSLDANGNLALDAKIEIENYVPQEMYIADNALVIIGGIYEKVSFSAYGTYFIDDCCEYLRYTKTNIRFYDITDTTNPQLKRDVMVDGTYLTSRVLDGALVYLVQDYFLQPEDTPFVSEDNNSNLIGLDDIYYFENMRISSYLVVGKIDLTDEAKHTSKVYLGISGLIYVSYNNIYCAEYYFEYNHGSSNYRAQTKIAKIDIDSLICTQVTILEGYIQDRYWMDEYEGYLRIVTTSSGSGIYRGTSSNLFVLDDQFDIVGKITNIAPTERVYSVRFNGTEASIVTFKNIDPLFKVDLSDPTKPIISEGLKEDGVSYYLHYIDGTSYMIGLGIDTYVNGYGAVVSNGVKLSLYDNSGAEAVNLSTIVFSNSKDCYYYSSAYYNPKEILYDKDLDIFAFTIAKHVRFQNSTSITNGLYVFGFSDGVLVQKAIFSDLEEPTEGDWYDYYDRMHDIIKRGARVGNYIYTVSDKTITSYSLENFEKVSSLTIGTYKSAKELFK